MGERERCAPAVARPVCHRHHEVANRVQPRGVREHSGPVRKDVQVVERPARAHVRLHGPRERLGERGGLAAPRLLGGAAVLWADEPLRGAACGGERLAEEAEVGVEDLGASGGEGCKEASEVWAG